MMKPSLIKSLPASKLAIVVVTGALIASGCSTVNPYTNEQQTAKATTGALIGAVAGAAVGVASSSKSDRGKGALIGEIGRAHV